MKGVLITGGTGTFGHAFVPEMLRANVDRIVVLSRDELKQAEMEREFDGQVGTDRLRFYLGDVRDERRLEMALHNISHIVHAAALKRIEKCENDPIEAVRTNVEGTANVLDAARAVSSRRLIFTSTGGAVYGEGDGQELPLREDAPIGPIAPYGQSKFAAEGYLALYERLYGLSSAALRLGNVYGPRQDPLGEAGVIAIFCGLLLAGERPTVYGNGAQTRDYIYVDDVVSAILAAAESAATGPINVGTGRETDVLELVSSLRKLGNVDGFEPEHAPPRIGEVQRISIDPSHAERELRWRSTTGLEEGLRETLDSIG